MCFVSVQETSIASAVAAQTQVVMEVDMGGDKGNGVGDVFSDV